MILPHLTSLHGLYLSEEQPFRKVRSMDGKQNPFSENPSK
jgi:hypothetical protein